MFELFQGDGNIFSNLSSNASAIASGTYEGSSMFGNIAQGFLNNYTGNRDQANLDITREREDSAIQRQVADAEAAGINPMALVGSGMGAPTSGAPNTQGRQDPVKAAMSIAQFDKQMAIMDAQANSLNAAADKSRADADYTRGPQSDLTRVQIDKVISDVDVNRARVDQIFQDISTAESQRLLNVAQRMAAEANVDLTEARTVTEGFQARFVEAGIDQRRAEILAIASHIELVKAQTEYQRAMAMSVDEQRRWMSDNGLPPNASLPKEVVIAAMVKNAVFGSDDSGNGSNNGRVSGGKLSTVEQLMRDAGIESEDNGVRVTEDDDGRPQVEGYEYDDSMLHPSLRGD
jgi:hypothetical protein